MNNWNKDFTEAPRKKSILVRSTDWDCPAIMYWFDYEDTSGWFYTETLLADVSDDVLSDDELLDCEWAYIPE